MENLIRKEPQKLVAFVALMITTQSELLSISQS